MRIEMWADLTCPWCFLGKRRLERALGMWPEEDGPRPEVVWRPYQVDPTAPRKGEPRDEDRARRFMELHSADQLDTYMSEMEQGEGPDFRWQPRWRVNTFDAHRLVALAYEQGGAPLQGEVKEQLLRAHFLRGENLGDPAVLVAAAQTAGLRGAAEALESGEGGARVRAELVRGITIGIAAAPTLTVGHRALAGAQEPEAILDFLRRAAREEETTATADSVATCTRDGVPADDPVELFRAAEQLLDDRAPLEALRLLKPLMREHGDDRAVTLLAARCFFLSAQLKSAEAALRRLIENSPDDDYAQFMLGRCLKRQNRDDEAVVHFRIAAALNPKPEHLKAVGTAGS